MIFYVCLTFPTKGVAGEAKICHSQQRTLFPWALESRPWKMLLKNSGAGFNLECCPTSKPNSYLAANKCWLLFPGYERHGGIRGPRLFHGGITRTAETNSYFPMCRLEVPKADGASRSSTSGLCAPNLTQTILQSEISWSSFHWHFRINLSPINSKLVFNKCLTSWLISLTSEGNFFTTQIMHFKCLLSCQCTQNCKHFRLLLSS